MEAVRRTALERLAERFGAGRNPSPASASPISPCTTPARSARTCFSQLGAEVIKIESAMRPDAFRKPHPVYGRMGPATFDQVASTKLSVRINLKKPEGVALAKRLVAVSDVAAESFRPGVIERLGLGYRGPEGGEARHRHALGLLLGPERAGPRISPAMRRCSVPGAGWAS